jgi:hypothetical protein
MEDFDYIGTGGFVMECAGGELLGLTLEQTQMVQQHCVWLENCFRHQTTESTSRIVRKPDWSIAIARHFMEVLSKGRTTVSSLQLYQELMEAGDQALVDLRVCSLVNYMDPTYKSDHRFLELVEATKCRFQLRANVQSDQWLRLLCDHDILLYRKETNFVVKLHKDQALTKDKTMARRKLDTRISDYLVHADRTIHAMLQIRKILAASSASSSSSSRQQPSSSSSDTDEGFSIYFETTESIPKDHHELIDRLAGGEAYIRTCADASAVQTEGYTVMASLDVLRRALRPLKDKPDMECSFRMDHPTPDTLGRFVNACCQQRGADKMDYPATLGLDASTNRYFCKKSVRDIYSILEYMADYATSARIVQQQGALFQLFELSSEDEAF